MRYPPTWPGCRYKHNGALVEITGFTVAPEGVYADYSAESERKHRVMVRPDVHGWIWHADELKPLTPLARKMLAIARRNKRRSRGDEQ